MTGDLNFILARVYFAVAVTFHIIFPAINIGLSWLILILEGYFVKTGEVKYKKLTLFWSKIFAMLFGVGVVTGITMSFMFGLTFSKLIDFAGNILGPLLSFEVLTAFFLEASFLGVMLFGWNRVSQKMHLFATSMVAFGTTLSAFWILSANSFMQTPSGFEVKGGIMHAVNWIDAIFNPSFGWRFAHMLNGSVITASLFMFGISCYIIKRGKDVDAMKFCAKLSSSILLISSLLQVYLGDSHGLNTLKHQPSKIAAIEGHWENVDGSQPIVIFGVPNVKEERNDYEVSIPYIGSIILTHTLDGKIPALKDIKKEDRPPVSMPFYSFRIMVGLGFWFIILGLWGYSASRRDKIGICYIRDLTNEEKNSKCHRFFKPMHKFMTNAAIYSSLLGCVAIISGWYVTEIGRQPWVIYGVMRSVDALTPNLDLHSLIFGISFSSLLYIGVSIVAFLYIKNTIQKGLT